MYRKCATERSAMHQKQVTQSLLELMAKIPYEQISVTQLCQAAGVTRRVFYHLFSSKTDALHALIDHAILDAEIGNPETSDPAVRFFRYWMEQQLLLDALLENQLTGLLLERMIWIAMNEDHDVRLWLRDEDREKGRDMLIFTLSGILGLIFSWHISGCSRTPEEMGALLLELTNFSPDRKNFKT